MIYLRIFDMSISIITRLSRLLPVRPFPKKPSKTCKNLGVDKGRKREYYMI